MTFFKKVVTSIKDFEKYPELANQSVISTIKYFMVLIAILTVIMSMVIIYQIYNFFQYIENDLPDFEFVEDTLQIELSKPIDMKNNNSIFKTFIVDTNDISDEQFKLYKNELSNSMTGLAFLKDKVLISVDSGMEPIEYSYSTLFGNMEEASLKKEDILNFFAKDQLLYTVITFFIIFFIYGFMYYFVETLMLVLVIMLLGNITSMIMKIRLRLYAVFNMAIYSFTLPIILLLIYSIIHTITGFEIIYFNVMYFGIACIYMITAILMIKADLIKRGQELTKIIEEQARIAEWQKANKENEKKQNDENENKKEEEKKQEKEDKKDESEQQNNENDENKEDNKNEKKDKNGQTKKREKR